MELGIFNPNWTGCFLRGVNLITDNHESYTLHELRFIRCQLNNWRRIAQANQKDLAKFVNQHAVIFVPEELHRLRDVLRLLDEKLPGYSIHQQILDQISPLRRRR